MASDRNPKIKKVKNLFTNLELNGEKYTRKPGWSPSTMVESHLQGIIHYNEFCVVSHNNKGASQGKYIIMNTNGANANFDSHDKHFNHPGGMQRIGDYMLVGVEDSANKKSHIRLYNLCFMKLGDNNEIHTPCLVGEFDLDARIVTGTGSVGITNYTQDGVEYYMIVTYNNGSYDFYRTDFDTPLESTKFGWRFNIIEKNLGYSSTCLITDKDNKVYLVGFRSEPTDSPVKDFIDYVEIDPNVTGTGQKFKDNKTSIHITTHHGSIVSVGGVHCRWAAGLNIDSEEAITVYVTQRNFVSGKFTGNTIQGRCKE